MYERNYHKTVLKTEEKPAKKGTRINWKLIILLTALAIVLVGSVFIIRLPSWQVKDVEVAGAQVADPGDVKEFIQNELKGNKLFFLPRTSIVLVPERSLEKKLKEQFPRFQTVSVSRKSFSALTVTVSEYQGIYLWCVDDNTCYFMDEKGIAFAPAPYFSGSAYPKIFVGEAHEVPFQALSAAQLEMTQLLLTRLPAISIIPTEFHYLSDHKLEVHFNHDGHQAMLIFDPTTDTLQALQALFTGLRTNPLATKFRDSGEVLEYIDLRFSNRVVYKFQ
jgi:hypothetical protein